MKRTVPVAVYRDGIRYVVGEAMVEVDDDLRDLSKLEVNITHPALSEILVNVKEGDFSIGREA